MEIRELVTFDDRLLRPSGGAIGALLDGLADIHARRPTADRFASEDDATQFAFKQRQLQHLLAPVAESTERRLNMRVACDLWVQVKWRGRTRPGVIDDLGTGGVFVSTLVRPRIGDPVELIIEPPEDADGMRSAVRCRGRAAWLGTAGRRGFGVSFSEPGSAQSEGLDNLIVALLGRLSPTLIGEAD